MPHSIADPESTANAQAGSGDGPAGPTCAATPTRVGWSNAHIHHCGLADDDRMNADVADAVSRIREEDFDRRTHFVGGCFENLDLERTRIPAVSAVLDQALICAGIILERPTKTLRCGFWLNLKGPGQSTSEHTHDESDELLSAVD